MPSSQPDVAIIGIGLHPFGRFEGVTALEMGAKAARAALRDAGIEWRDVQFAYGGSVDGGNPDTLVNRLGLTGIPFVNVTNGCATGASALIQAYNTIRSGAFDIGLVVGFDKHPRGAFAFDPGILGLGSWYGENGLLLSTQFFAMKINRYMQQFGISHSTLAKVAAKNYRNGSMNPNAWRRKAMSAQDILASPMLNYPLRHYMFCSPDEGGAAVVLCRGDLARKYRSKPVYLRAAAVRSRRFGAFEVWSPWLPLEMAPSPAVDASKVAYEMAGIGPTDVDIAQLQDSESGAEIMHMAENGLCEDGDQEKMIQAGETDISGRLPINTDGGLIANGEPVGASGLRQTYELVLQLRGDAGERQVPNTPRVGYAQVYGAPGTGAVTILTT
jgi:acetyl-CoA acetyltransferase